MRMRSGLVFSSVALALVFASPAFSQQTRTTAQSQPAQKQQISQSDKEFVKGAAIGGMAEVKLGQVAEQNAQDQRVKEFGARMVRDHGAANNELMMIVARKDVSVPQTLDDKHQKKLDKLSKMHGAEFDRAYMKDMVADHDKDVTKFKHEAQSAKDPDVKAFAEKTLPVLEEHQKLAQDISKSLPAHGASGSSRAPR